LYGAGEIGKQRKIGGELEGKNSTTESFRRKVANRLQQCGLGAALPAQFIDQEKDVRTPHGFPGAG
jgi:hypothetical protein